MTNVISIDTAEVVVTVDENDVSVDVQEVIVDVLASETGPQGATGPAGPAGAAGAQGPAGQDGVASATAPLALDGSHTLSLNYDNTTLSVGPSGLTVIGGTGSGGDANTLDGHDSTYFIDISASSQTKTGDLSVGGTMTASIVDLNEAQIKADLKNINVTSTFLIDSFVSANYRGAEYIFQFSQGNNHTMTKMLLIHNGTDISISEYGSVDIGLPISYTFEASFSLGNLELTLTCNTANIMPVDMKFSRTLFDA